MGAVGGSDGPDVGLQAPERGGHALAARVCTPEATERARLQAEGACTWRVNKQGSS